MPGGTQRGDSAGFFQVAAEPGVVDCQPPQVAEGSFGLAGQAVAFEAEPGVLGGQFRAAAGALGRAVSWCGVCVRRVLPPAAR